MKTAYSFIRFSSKKQDFSSSVLRQTEMTVRYAKLHGLKLDKDTTLKSLAVSGSTGAHIKKGAALAEFLKAAKKGKIPSGTALLVEKFDRLSRLEPMQAVRLFLDILECGIEIHTVADGQVFTEKNVNDDISRLYLAVGGLFTANRFSKDLGSRVRFAWEDKKQLAALPKKKRAIATTKVPLWLDVVGRKTVNGKRVGGKIIKLKDRVAVVQKIFNLKMQGLGRRGIANHLNKRIRIAGVLNAEGVPTWGRAKRWQDTYVQAILKNPAVTGRYLPHKTVKGERVPVTDEKGKQTVIKDYYPRIIEDDEFEACSKVQHKNTSTSPFVEECPNLFPGLMFDGYTGDKMNFVRTEGRAYLYSDARRTNPEADTCGWIYKDFEEQFKWLMRHIDWHQLIPKPAPRNVKELAVLREEIKHLEGRDEYYAGLLDEAISEAVVKKSNEIATKLNEAREKFKEVRKEKEQVITKKEFEKLLKEDDFETRVSLRFQISKLVKRIELFPNGLPEKHRKGIALRAIGRCFVVYMQNDLNKVWADIPELGSRVIDI